MVGKETRKQRLQSQKRDLVQYMLSKIEWEDWHAVMDAAADIREIEAELKGMDHGQSKDA